MSRPIVAGIMPAAVQTMLHEASSYQSLEDNLLSAGYEKVQGMHQCSEVFIHPDYDGVIKLVDYNDTAYLRFVNLARRLGCHKYLPTIHEVVKLRLRDYSQAVVIEKLLSYSQAHPSKDGLQEYYQFKHADNNLQHIYQNTPKSNRPLRLVLRLLIRMTKQDNNIMVDLNSANMMFRTSGDMVITDPIAPRGFIVDAWKARYGY